MPDRESPSPRRLRAFAAPLLTAALVFFCALAWTQPAEGGFVLGALVTVNTTVDIDVANSVCSLREAIIATNTNMSYHGCSHNGATGGDSIVFNVGPGTPFINVTSQLPAITAPVSINGNTGDSTRVELRGFGGTNNSDNGLKIASTAAGSGIGNLVINNFGGSGILIEADNVLVTGSFIGTYSAGNIAAGNNVAGIYVKAPGARIGGTTGTTPGGPCTGDCNLLSGNGGFGGIFIGGTGGGTIVEGNFVGTDLTGNFAIPNNSWGVYLGAISTVGGTSAAARNVISGNTNQGIRLEVPSIVEGNYIGTNAAGDAALPNDVGISAQNTSTSVLIGGIPAGAGNVISGNNSAGIEIVKANGLQVFGNLIGVAADGTSPLPNAEGLRIYDGSTNNAIGGTGNGLGNEIAFNRDPGVVVSGDPVQTNGNPIRGNSIHDNDPLGISNEDGGNLELAPPVINSVGALFAGSGVSGTACPNCQVDIYSDDDGQGRIYEATVTADGNGVWGPYADTPLTGPNITATANDSLGNTSEFSAPFTVPAPTPTPSPSPTLSPTPTATPIATPTPTGSPSANRIQGDINCDGHVDGADFDFLLEFAAALNDGKTPGACPDVGEAVPAAQAAHPWGDVNCDDAVNALDALYVLAHKAGIELPHPGCPAIGSPLT